ncbi:DUF4097 family beta strand repeat protein [candidate division KSB1 bacterium]|nr:DUF4097 family beta strand repeat protein [candidate division KSB1 bacterium]
MCTYLKFNLTTLICLCLMTSVFAEEATRVEKKSIPFSLEGVLTIMSDDGEIQIDAWDQELILIEMTYHAWGSNAKKAEKRLDDLQVEIIESNNRIVIREMSDPRSWNAGLLDVLDKDFWKEKRWRDTQIDFIIKVPQKIDIKLNHDSGHLSITGTKGSVHISADEGRVSLSEIQSEVIRVELDEADVWLTDIKQQQEGLCQIVMDEGDIRCTSIQMKSLEIQCDEGNISGVDIDVQQCRVETDEGHIDFKLYPQSDGRYSFYTDEGDIDLSLPQSSSVQFKLWTDEGRIQSDAELSIRRFDDGEQMDGQIGDSGGAMLKASTDEGDIRLVLE